ncbi:MAG: EAL domain-containing protein [Actinomycetota bacterium]
MTDFDPHGDVLSTRQAFTDDVRAERRTRFAVVDQVSPLLLALAAAVVPLDIDVSSRILLVIALAAIAPIDLVVRRLVAPAWANYTLLFVRLGVAAIAAFAIPSLHAAFAVTTAVLCAGSMVAEPRRRIGAMLAFGVIALTVIGIVGDVEWWAPTTVMVFASVVSVDVWFREWDRQRSEVDRRHDAMIDRARMFVWEIDETTREIVRLTGNVREVLGYDTDELVGTHITDHVVSVEVDGTTRALHPSTHGRRTLSTLRHRDGHHVALREIRLEPTSPGIVRGVSIDVTELVETSRALRHQAAHDPLTDLANRSRFENEVNAALDRRPDDEIVALLMLDLDRFKEINDVLGHATGDGLLITLADRLSTDLDDVEVVARLGGDEFGFLVCGDLTTADVERLAERIGDVVTQPVAVDDLTLSVSASVGVAIAPRHGDSYDLLLQHADIATYEAKRTGEGHRVFDQVPGELSRERLELMAQIPGSLDDGHFVLAFQPKVDLSDGRITGAEGLARWDHPTLGELSPGTFLDVLEVSSEYHRFTRRLLGHAVEMLARTAEIGRPIEVALNLGSVNFLDRSLPDAVRTLLGDHGVEPRRLTLEVTESELLDEFARDVPVFEALRGIGVRLSIDDFGTGYSSLHRLRALDVDEVKIDRSFTAGLAERGEDEVIVKSVIRLGRLLGHRIVAEGIETAPQLELLRSFGCDEGQGYLFARPRRADDFLDLLASTETFPIDPAAPRRRSPPGDVDEREIPIDGAVEMLDDVVFDGPVDLLAARRSDPAVRRALDALYERYRRIDPRISVVVKDLDGRLVDANARCRAFFGDQTYHELVGRDEFDFLASDEGPGNEFVVGGHTLRRTEHPEFGLILRIDGQGDLAHQLTAHRLVDGAHHPAGQVETIRPRRGIGPLGG